MLKAGGSLRKIGWIVDSDRRKHELKPGKVIDETGTKIEPSKRDLRRFAIRSRKSLSTDDYVVATITTNISKSC